MVRLAGLEPARLSPLPPQSSVSANSTISAPARAYKSTPRSRAQAGFARWGGLVCKIPVDFYGNRHRILPMPEKTLSQIPRPLREQCEKGKVALDRRNYDYATAIFTAVLEQEPAFYDCRELLRITQHKKGEGKGTGFFKRMMSGASSSPMV